MKKLIFLLLVGIPTITYSQEIPSGKALFATNCGSCHNMENKVVGPALKNTIELQGREWTSKWIVNSAELIASGDAHANEVFNEYQQMPMPAFNYLKTEELNAILDYMEGYNKEKSTKVTESAPSMTTELSTESDESLEDTGISFISKIKSLWEVVRNIPSNIQTFFEILRNFSTDTWILLILTLSIVVSTIILSIKNNSKNK